MSGPRPGRYATAFLVAVLSLSGAAALVFAQLHDAPDRAAPRPSAPPIEAGDTFVVRRVGEIRPDASAYRRFEESDRAWREATLRRARVVMVASGETAPAWRPSPGQALDDAVFLRARAGRPAEAAALLVAWLERHPDDAPRHRAAAQLLARIGSADASIRHWEAAARLRPDDDALRAELARALLWSRRYARAAAEWRALAARRPAEREPRLALAQSLAWGGDAAAAEPLLAALVRETPGDSATRAMLRAVRAGLAPDAGRAARWAAEDPSWVPYRVALARALDAAGDGPGASRAWASVLADSATRPLLVEAAGSAATAGDSVGAARLLGRAVAMAPADRGLRARWAAALAWSGDRDAARRELDALLAGREEAPLLLARGELRAMAGDERGAMADLQRAAALAPSYEAWALIGDLHRWRGDWSAASRAYAQALALRPGDARVASALAATRASARAATLASAPPDERGWVLGASYAEDNAGYLYLAGRAARAVRVGGATTVGLGAEQRRVAQRAARAPTRWLAGYAIDVTAVHRWRAVELSATGGIARHALVRDVPIGRLALTGRRGPASATLEATRAPAYERLWTMRSLVDPLATERLTTRPLQARTLGARAAVPVGRLAVEVGAERLRLDDGNARTSASVAARLPIARGLGALYSGGALGFSDGAGAYWSPERYTSHAAGLEYVAAPRRGVRVAARVLPGVGRAAERAARVPGAPPPDAPWVRQVAGGGDLAIERARWSATLSAGYGRGGRGGGGQAGYQSLQGALSVRVSW